ncbi:MAG: hypothetical protein U0575_13975 [Phycisphaerales bacterium]
MVGEAERIDGIQELLLAIDRPTEGTRRKAATVDSYRAKVG